MGVAILVLAASHPLRGFSSSAGACDIVQFEDFRTGRLAEPAAGALIVNGHARDRHLLTSFSMDFMWQLGTSAAGHNYTGLSSGGQVFSED